MSLPLPARAGRVVGAFIENGLRCGYVCHVAKLGGIKVRLDEVDRARLEAIAEHYALTIGAAVRMLAKREVDSLRLRVESRPVPKRSRNQQRRKRG